MKFNRDSRYKKMIYTIHNKKFNKTLDVWRYRRKSFIYKFRLNRVNLTSRMSTKILLKSK